jgi:signal transduction histidine kinase
VFTRLAVKEREAGARARALAEELARANDKLREYAARVEDLATVAERNRVAREIHDTLGHSLSVVHVQLEAARAVLARDPASALAAIVRARAVNEEGLAEVRRSVAMLRGPPLDGRPLPNAVAQLVDEARATGLEASLEIQGEARPVAAPAAFALYRAAQEALTNVRKHAHAGSVRVRLSFGDSKGISLQVGDDGCGAGGDRSGGGGGGGFGLLGVQERIALLGGGMFIETSPGRGYTLTVELPA